MHRLARRARHKPYFTTYSPTTSLHSLPTTPSTTPSTPDAYLTYLCPECRENQDFYRFLLSKSSDRSGVNYYYVANTPVNETSFVKATNETECSPIVIGDYFPRRRQLTRHFQSQNFLKSFAPDFRFSELARISLVRAISDNRCRLISVYNFDALLLFTLWSGLLFLMSFLVQFVNFIVPCATN